MNKQRLIILCSLSAILVALVVLCCIRWNTWFYNPEEPPYTPCDTICRVQLTYGRNGAMSHAISWQCGASVEASYAELHNKASQDTLKIVADSRLFCTQGGHTVCYWAYLDNLSVGQYAYCIHVGEQSSRWYSFDIKDFTDEFTFVYVGDVQDTINGTINEKFAEIQQRVQPDCWLFGGDVIERPHDQYWNEYFRMTESFRTSTPMLAVAGNHEYIKGINLQLEERFLCVFPYLQEDKTSALYALNLPNVSFYLLDSNNDAWTFPHQRSWLKKQLNQSNAQWNIAMLHHPLYSLRGKCNNLLVRWAFADLLNEKPVDLVLAGHEHAYARRLTNGATPIYLVSQCSPKDYHILFDSGYDRYAVGQRFYQVVHIVGDTLQFSTYTLNHELYDYIELHKSPNGVEVVDDYSSQPEYLKLDVTRYRKSAEKQTVYQNEMQQRLSR